MPNCWVKAHVMLKVGALSIIKAWRLLVVRLALRELLDVVLELARGAMWQRGNVATQQSTNNAAMWQRTNNAAMWQRNRAHTPRISGIAQLPRPRPS
jgi:hypothetical protein